MDIEIDMKVADKNGKSLGTIDQVINDMWTGKPRKYVIMLDDDTGAMFFKPDQVAGVAKGKVTLSVSRADIESTE